MPDAERVAASAQDFEQALRDLGRADVGIIRLTCPEPIAFRLTQSGILDRFHAKLPNLKVEFVLSDQYVDLAKGEADVVLRSGDTDDSVLCGRKIANSLWAIYSSRRSIERHGAPASVADLAHHPLIRFEESMSKHRTVTWFREVAPTGTNSARNTSVLGLIYAAMAGVGVAPLPMSLGDAEENLVRVIGPLPVLTRAWRILTHPDQRRTLGIAAYFDFVLHESEALRPILTG